VALPNDRPSKKKQPSEKIEAQELADIAERLDPVPKEVVDAARDAFRSRHIQSHPETQQASADSAVEAAKNVEG